MYQVVKNLVFCRNGIFGDRILLHGPSTRILYKVFGFAEFLVTWLYLADYFGGLFWRIILSNYYSMLADFGYCL